MEIKNFKFIDILVLFFLSCFLITGCGGGSGGSGSASSGTPVQASWQGQWTYVDTGTTITLGSTTTLNLSQGDPNQLIESRVDSSGKTTNYYLLRAGIPNVNVTGNLASMPGVTSSNIALVSPVSKQSGVGGAAGINLILQNVANTANSQNVSVDSNTGNFTTTVPSGTYNVTATQPSTGLSANNTVNIQSTSTDTGNLTLVSSGVYNFSTIISDSTHAPFTDKDWIYFGTIPGQADIVYSKNIIITNIGTASIPGVNTTITSTDPNVRTLVPTATSAGLAAGASMAVPITFSLVAQRRTKLSPSTLTLPMPRPTPGKIELL